MKTFALLFLLLTSLLLSPAAAEKKILLIAGTPSHGPLAHEHNAGVLLLKKCLEDVPGVNAVAHLNGWPKEAGAFEDADAVLIYCDGGAKHLLLQENRLREFDRVMKKGAGLALLHYGVEPTREKGQKEFMEWIGGAFEINWSVNPHWTADFSALPTHPITRGVKPFQINDEWYFNMRFVDGMKGVTPILSAVPPESTMSRPDGDHSGNPHVRKMVAERKPQHVVWAYERPNGGRGFGFTGAHNHLNWGNDDFRKTVLNALLWIARAEVPKDGVQSTVTEDDLMQNLDPKRGSIPPVRPKAP